MSDTKVRAVVAVVDAVRFCNAIAGWLAVDFVELDTIAGTATLRLRASQMAETIQHLRDAGAVA